MTISRLQLWLLVAVYEDTGTRPSTATQGCASPHCVPASGALSSVKAKSESTVECEPQCIRMGYHTEGINHSLPGCLPCVLCSNCSRDRGLRAFLEAAGAVLVLFFLSWRLAPAVSIVILVTAVAAALYRRSTRPVEAAQSAALQRMAGVAYQAFQNMRTVRSFAGEALERERFQSEVVASFAAGRQFGSAKASFEATNRMAIHLSLLTLYAWGGWLVSQGIMPVGILVSGIGFTFSLMYATQGAVNTLSELRRASGAFERVSCR